MFLKTNINRPAEFISAGHFISSTPFLHQTRQIDNYEIIIGLEKTLYIQQENKNYEINPGEILLLKPDEVHKGVAHSEPGLSFYWMHFICRSDEHKIDEEEMVQEMGRLKKFPSPQNQLHNIFLPLYKSRLHLERLHILFRQLLHVDNTNYYTKYSTDFILSTLLIEISEQTVSHYLTLQENIPGNFQFNEILEWTRIHALEKVTLQQVANTFNYNKDYLSRLFKKETGINFNEYVHILKMAKAKELLSVTNDSIQQISFKTGITDEKYFMKLFKRYEKMTPSKYRKAFYRTYLNND